MDSTLEKNDECTLVCSRSSSSLSIHSCHVDDEVNSSKSPVTIQDWVDAIGENKPEERVTLANVEPDDKNDPTQDILHLGEEAALSHDKAKTQVDDFADDEETRLIALLKGNNCGQVLDRRVNLLLMKEQQASLQSDVSSLSASSLSSLETILESRRENPEEILLNLGFGGKAEPLDPLARIPKRFLNPSKVPGNNIDQFVRHQEELLETLDSGFCGYRGLSGFLKESHDPTGLVGKLLAKIRVNDREVRSSSPTCSLTSMSEVAFSILAANSFRNLTRKTSVSPKTGSILDPVNREFLEQQGEVASCKTEGKRRIIVGQDEFRVDCDGGLVLSEKVEKSPTRRTEENSLQDERKSPESKTPKLWNVCREFNERRKTNRLIRQNSVDDGREHVEENYSMDSVAQSTPNDKLVPCKESFELEELPSHDGGEVHEGEIEHEHDGDDDVVVRVNSALSDSSGFLDGEALELLAVEEICNTNTETELQTEGEDNEVSSEAEQKENVDVKEMCEYTDDLTPCTTDCENIEFQPEEKVQHFSVIVSDEDNKIVSMEGISDENFCSMQDSQIDEEVVAITDCAEVQSDNSVRKVDSPSGSSKNSSSHLKEDEYDELQQLLCVISEENQMHKLSRHEFINKPIHERLRMESVALQLALQKYQQTLNGEESLLNKIKPSDEMKAEERYEFSVLRDIRSGICQELAQLQNLLASRMRRASQMNKSFLPVSLKLIRQFSLLLHQQNSLCRQLEQINERQPEQSSHEQFTSGTETPETLRPLVEENPYQQMNKRMRYLFQTCQENFLAQVQQTVHEEIHEVRREIENERLEINKMKSYVQKVVLDGDFKVT